MNKLVFKTFSIFLVGLIFCAVLNINAQSLFDRNKSNLTYKGVFSDSAIAAAADLDQCANGGVGDPVQPCSGANWENGNVNESKGHYVEGDSVPYRMILTGLVPNSTGNTLTIEWDTTKNGKHAVDYITSFDRTETLAMGNDPCSGVAGCSLGTFTTFPIPTDSFVTAGQDQIPMTGDDITQISGVITLFGGTITGVSAYSRTGSYAGDSSTAITITFTAGPNTSAVMAWGGHIGKRTDWGIDNSAIDISGSPYHMRLIEINGGGGNQDRALSAGAVAFPAILTIIKNAVPNSIQDFAFTTTGSGVSNFSLDDDSGTLGGDNTLSNEAEFDAIVSFGAGNTITVTESVTPGWTLTSIVCTEDPGGLPQTDNSTTSVGLRRATIIAEEGEFITCTFTNTLLLAAPASMGGRVINADGYGIGGVSVVATNLNNGEIYTALTNPFGVYTFEGLIIGDYSVSVSSKRYSFQPDTIIVSVQQDLSEIDFIASP